MLIPISILKGFIFISNRLASWFGSGYFVRKGIRRKEKRYFNLIIAVLLSVVMFFVLWIMLKKLH